MTFAADRTCWLKNKLTEAVSAQGMTSAIKVSPPDLCSLVRELRRPQTLNFKTEEFSGLWVDHIQ